MCATTELITGVQGKILKELDKLSGKAVSGKGSTLCRKNMLATGAISFLLG